jgi:hypothetical protein
MKEKVVKAYRAAWRWPEVYSESPAVIWTSRAIAFLLPVVLLALTFITGLPIFGFSAAVMVTLVIGLALVWVTVESFYKEFDTVEEFQAKEARIKEFFHGFPSITDVPLIENEPGEWVAYGHVDPRQFIEAVQKVIYEATGDGTTADKYIGLEGSVGHLYASFSNPEEGHWGEGIDLCKSSSETCFPITRVTV